MRQGQRRVRCHVRSHMSSLVFLLLPSRFKNFLLRRLGHTVHPRSRVGVILVSGGVQISLEAGARIGHFNVFRDLESVSLHSGAVIGQWNWVSAARPLRKLPDSSPTLSIGMEAALTSRHYLDCSGGVSIGDFSTIAGVRSTFVTHGIDWKQNRQSVRSISVGRYCLIGSNATLCPGASVPDRTIVGMGSVVGTELNEGDALWAGARTTRWTNVSSAAYFDRRQGYVE